MSPFHCSLALAAMVVIRIASAAGSDDACAAPLSAALANSCVVAPGVLWRGAKPDAAGAAELLALGVRTVVNLELLHDDLAAFRDARPSHAPAPGLNYFRIHDWEPNVWVAPALLDAHVAEFLAIVKTQPKPIYVHCRSGQNRTGVMVAAYRVLLDGWTPQAAIAEMGKYQGLWFKPDAEYIRGLTGEHRAALEAAIQSQLPQVRPDAQLECSERGCRETGPGETGPGSN